MTFTMCLLGPPRLVAADGTSIRLPVKTYALMARLLLASEAEVTRSSLTELLWPEANTDSSNLRKLIWTIRQVQARHRLEFLNIHGKRLRPASVGVQIDLLRLLALLDGGGNADLAELCRLYSGELLEGLDFDTSEGRFWLAVQRGRLRNAFVLAVAEAIEAPQPRSDRRQIRSAAKKLIEIEPFNEAACRALMQCFAADGEVAQIRQAYDALRQQLRRDLDVEPTAKTKSLFQRLTGTGPRTTPEVATGDGRALGARDGGLDAASPGPPVWPAPTPQTAAGVPKLCILFPTGTGADVPMHDLAASLMDDVTIGLCRSKALSIVAPYTAWQLAPDDPRDDGLARFGVDYAVETRLSRFPDAHRLMVKLFAVRNREIVWAEQYAFDMDSAARRYRDLSTRVTALLAGEIERREIGRHDPEQHPTAYGWYLIGQRALNTLDLASIRRSRTPFRSAIAIAPDFAPAVSALARSFQLEWLLCARGDHEMLERAEKLANRAVKLDSLDARGYRELGFCSLYAGRYDESFAAYATAEDLNPQHADLLAEFADALVHGCEIDSAIAKIKLAIALNPLCPDRYWWIASGAYYFAEDYHAVIEFVSNMRNRAPALRLLAASHAMLGNAAEARRCVDQAMKDHPNFTVSKWLEIIPTRRPASLRHYEQALRLAGFR
jgi:DNA-binding SARP family transcriptional activator/TolB-like protein